MNNEFSGTDLGAMLRSENRALKKQALDYIEEHTKGLTTEAARAEALGVSKRAWSQWCSDGLVKRIPVTERTRGRPRAPTEPTKLELGRQWLVVDWIQGKHGTNGRMLRKAEVKTSTGKSFTLPAWEGTRFVEAMTSLGWHET